MSQILIVFNELVQFPASKFSLNEYSKLQSSNTALNKATFIKKGVVSAKMK